MEKLKLLIDNISIERQQLIDEIKQIEEKSIIKRYLELKQKNKYLLDKQKKLIKEMKIKEFDCCEHLWITTKVDHDYIEGRSQIFRGCIKCGLNQEIFDKANSAFMIEFLPLEDQIMYNYMKNNQYMRGKKLQVSCDFDLAKSIYLKIKTNNPDIDDEIACQFFEITVNNIEKNKLNERKEETKRLVLK